MKKIIVCLLSILVLSSFFACSTGTAPDVEPTAAPIGSGTEIPSALPSETASAAPADTPSPTGTEPSEQPSSYIEALSDDEKDRILLFAADWYAMNFFEYEVLSMKFADDDDLGYEYYSQYKPGEIIILLVETTHGGRGVYRKCFITVSGSDYNVINEGY